MCMYINVSKKIFDSVNMYVYADKRRTDFNTGFYFLRYLVPVIHVLLLLSEPMI